MSSLLLSLSIISIIVAVWFAWRYYDLKRRMNSYANLIRYQPDQLPTDLKNLENLSNSIASLKTAFDLRLSTAGTEHKWLDICHRRISHPSQHFADNHRSTSLRGGLHHNVHQGRR